MAADPDEVTGTIDLWHQAVATLWAVDDLIACADAAMADDEEEAA